MSAADPDPSIPAYRPRGAALAVMEDTAEEIVLAGPAGTGKSRALLQKMHACLEAYPRSRALLVRKTRASLTETGLVTFEEQVLPPGHPARTGVARRNRQSYAYPNGSILALAGLDNAVRIMSTEYDLILVLEATELTESDWEMLLTRLRNGKMPFQQILGDCNPDTPTHWLRRRADSGRLRMLESRHEDNPRLWDAAKNGWTPFGQTYLAKLERLTGPRYQRLRHGRWVGAEGVVYEGWDRALHLIDRRSPLLCGGGPGDVPVSWPRFWAVDFGYTNPFVWQAWAQDPDGRLFRYREIYHTHRLVEDHARDILNASAAEPRPLAILCDHDAEDRATLERYLGLVTTAAHKSVRDGIQAVAGRLRPAGDGKPRLFLLRDSLLARDEELAEAHRPTCTEEEIDGYVWNTRSGRHKGEEPLKEGDHGMDALRYLVAARDLVQEGWSGPGLY